MARPECESCRPEWSKAWPSGPAWAHARNCALYPGQKVRIKRTKAEEEARRLHPAGKALSSGW